MTDPQSKGVFDDDPFGGIKNERGNPAPNPKQISFFHSRSDVDTSQFAQHHTIGIKHNQACAGDHVHDGKSSRKIGVGLALSVSGSKGGNAALASLLTMLGQIIDFTDSTT